jgi:hypothetical protein
VFAEIVCENPPEYTLKAAKALYMNILRKD